MEIKLAAIWSDTLGGEPVCAEDDFFQNLGGHSLLAARLVTRLRSQIHLPISVRDLYRYPTIRHSRSISNSAGGRGQWACFWRYSTQSDTCGKEFPDASALASRGLLYAANFRDCPYHGDGFNPGGDWHLGLRAYELGSITLAQLVGSSLAIFAFTYPFFVFTSIAGKWLLVGRYKPGAKCSGAWPTSVIGLPAAFKRWPPWSCWRGLR